MAFSGGKYMQWCDCPFSTTDDPHLVEQHWREVEASLRARHPDWPDEGIAEMMQAFEPFISPRESR